MPGVAVLRASPIGGSTALDPLEGEALEDHRANFRLLRRLLTHILEPFDLVVSDYLALKLASKGPVRPGVVSLFAGISPAATTELLDRLEARGLVTRAPDPTDRRATLISPTKKGDKVRQEAALAYRKFLDEVTGEMSRAGLAALQSGSRELRGILERRIADAPPPR